MPLPSVCDFDGGSICRFMKTVNVYDFDGTIYDGDSSIDFFKFVLKRDWRSSWRIFPIVWAGVLYLLKIKEKEYFKSVFFGFVQDMKKIDESVNDFWDLHDGKIKKFYLKQHSDNDIIISASPEFLLMPIAKKMHCELIATDVDKKTGKLLSKNCYGAEKVRRFKEKNVKAGKFYSDSLSDTPLAEVAEAAFMVNGETIMPWGEYVRKSDK